MGVAMTGSVAFPQRAPRILWANRYCLLDTSSGASITARQHLLELVRRGWEVAVVGATVFDHERGQVLVRDFLDEKRPEALGSDTPYVKITDADNLTHHLVVTQHWHCDAMTNRELNALYALAVAYLDEFAPDVVYFYGGNAFDLLIAEEAQCREILTVAMLVNPNYVGGVRWCRDVDLILTDSQATASFYQEKAGLQLVPMGTFIDPAKVVVPGHERRHVLFVNPAPEKGAFLVAEIAYLLAQRRPDIVFEVVESRGSWGPIAEAVTQTLAGAPQALPNVLVTPTQADMRPVYGRARVLLAPSLWWESGARVIAEAMLNGIPAIITAHGGSPEMAGDGGIQLQLPPEFHEPPYNRLLAPEALAPLIDRLVALFDDEALYAEYVAKAERVGRERHSLAHNAQRLDTTLRAALIVKRRGVCGAKQSGNGKPAEAGEASKPAVTQPEDTTRALLAQLMPFVPHSAHWAGGLSALLQLTLEGVPSVLAALQQLAASIPTRSVPLDAPETVAGVVEPQPLDALALTEAQRQFAERLAERFDHYGSDKHRVHGYEAVYAHLLAGCAQSQGALLEIGLGTCHLDTPSNMGREGRPGASVRAFRDLLPGFRVYGADVDQRILFEEERIRTFAVDQTRPESLQELRRQIAEPLDLVIDDGLHAPHSNLNTLLFALEALKPGGWLVIEDVTAPMLAVWHIVLPLLYALGHKGRILQCREALVVLVQKEGLKER